MSVKWLHELQAHDYGAADDYLSMLAEGDTLDRTVAGLKAATPVYRKAKDILRAAGLALLPENNPHLRSDLAKISNGEKLSPIGVCASYLTDENTAIPCRLVSWQK